MADIVRDTIPENLNDPITERFPSLSPTTQVNEDAKPVLETPKIRSHEELVEKSREIEKPKSISEAIVQQSKPRENPESFVIRNHDKDYYQIKHRIGIGGQAEVYDAIDLKNGRAVVIKMPNIRDKIKEGNLEGALKAYEAFIKEGDILASMNHINVGGVLDKGETHVPDQPEEIRTPYIVMPRYTKNEGYVGLHEMLFLKRKLEPKQVLTLIQQIGSAVDYGAKKSIEFTSQAPENFKDIAKVIHRDIKPNNIVWNEKDDIVKLLDYGLAGIKEDPEGGLTGTPEMISPEAVDGKVLDERADLFSLGILAYMALTGEHPYGEKDDTPIAVMAKIYHYDFKDKPLLEMDDGAFYVNFFKKALAKDPNERFQNAKEMTDAFAKRFAEVPKRIKLV